MKNDETRVGNQYVLSEFDMEVFGGSLILEILEFRYPKFAIFEDFGESFQLQSLRKKSKVRHTKTMFHNDQLGIRSDGSEKSDRKFLNNLNANFGISTYVSARFKFKFKIMLNRNLYHPKIFIILI